MTVLVVALLPALMALGWWQLDRAADKRASQARYLERLGQPPRVPPASLADAGFLRVSLDGEYQPDRHYLVDNRVRDGRPGYWVVSHFRANDGRVYLVNRGWLAAPASRDELPNVTTPDGRQRLVGVIWPDLGLPPLLAPDPWPARWPKRVQRLDVARMAEDGAAVAAFEVRLEPGQPGVLAAAPVHMNFMPERHQGYAVQWFGLAVVLIVGYVVFGFRRG
jgi:cytochrome oxidase assembly protein ShyY1